MSQMVDTQEGKPETEIKIDNYSLLVGFEANLAETAFVERKVGILKNKVEKVQILQGEGSDYGHAFFYITKNNVVEAFFSFGPTEELGDIEYKKGEEEIDGNEKIYANGYVNKRPSTTSYLIYEVVQIFKINITEKKFHKIKQKVAKVEAAVLKGKPYNVILNDTGAEEAEDILDDVIDDLPNGKGYIEIDGKIPPFRVVNPYMWCSQFYKKYGDNAYIYPEYPEDGKGVDLFDADGEHDFSVSSWKLENGQLDPLFENGYYEN